jgi:hypothetical protein
VHHESDDCQQKNQECCQNNEFFLDVPGEYKAEIPGVLGNQIRKLAGYKGMEKVLHQEKSNRACRGYVDKQARPVMVIKNRPAVTTRKPDAGQNFSGFMLNRGVKGFALFASYLGKLYFI